jgi:hypothetical protein
MRWPGLTLISMLPFVAASALGKLYHPEYLRARHGPALIDCGGGFESALQQYFRDDAKRDGLPVSGTPTLTVATARLPMSRFTARFSGETFTGFVYVDPTMTEGEGEPEEAEDDPRDRVCSASFVDSHATLEERRQLELGWNETRARLHLEAKVAPSEVP